MADKKARTLLMIYATRNEITGHNAFAGSLRHTPTMDGGSAEIAGANFCPYIPGHASLLAIHGTATYRPSLDIKKAEHLGARPTKY